MIQKKRLLVFLVGMNSFLFFHDVTAVLICVQNELVCVCLRRCCCWQSAVTVVKCSWKKKKKKEEEGKKKRKGSTWTLEAARRKDLPGAVMSVCQMTYRAEHAPALQNHALQKRNGSCLQTRQTPTFLFSTSVTVATSQTSGMSFALRKKARARRLKALLMTLSFFILDGGGGLLMIPSQLFVFPPSSLKIQVTDKDFCLDLHFSSALFILFSQN